jgi:hypothetical protein
MLNSMSESISGVLEKNKEMASALVIPPLEPDKQNEKNEEQKEEDDMAKSGLQMIGGLGLDQHKCFDVYPGENDKDPFSVPRDVTKDRQYVMIATLAMHGQLQNYGCVMSNDKKANEEAIRNFFDTSWKENCRIYDKLVNVLQMPDRDGLSAFSAMAESGELANYGVSNDTPNLADAYDHLVKCFKMKKVREACLSQMNKQLPKQS